MIELDTKTTTAVTALAFAPDGSRLLVGYAKGSVQEWDAFGGLIATEPSDGREGVVRLAWSPAGDGWGYANGVEAVVLAAAGERRIPMFRSGTKGDPSGGNHALGFAYLTAGVLVVGTGHPTLEWTGLLALCHVHGAARDKPPTCEIETFGVRGLDVHRESRLVAWITGRAQLKLWRTDRPDKFAIPLKKTASTVAISPDGLTVAVAIDWVVQTFSTVKRQPLHELKGHTGKVTSVCFSPDGARVITGSWDETVREWDAATGKLLRTMNWKVGKIAALSPAADGTRVAAGTTAGRVVIWDVD